VLSRAGWLRYAPAMTPEQQTAYDAVLGTAHRVAAQIAELPHHQRATAIKVAQDTIMENVTDYGITDPGLLNIFNVGIALVLRDEETWDNPDG
jgi:hypothetical protein